MRLPSAGDSSIERFKLAAIESFRPTVAASLFHLDQWTSGFHFGSRLQ